MLSGSYYSFNSLAAAQAAVAANDAPLGFPWPGTDADGAAHGGTAYGTP